MDPRTCCAKKVLTVAVSVETEQHTVALAEKQGFHQLCAIPLQQPHTKKTANLLLHGYDLGHDEGTGLAQKFRDEDCQHRSMTQHAPVVAAQQPLLQVSQQINHRDAHCVLIADEFQNPSRHCSVAMHNLAVSDMS